MKANRAGDEVGSTSLLATISEYKRILDDLSNCFESQVSFGVAFQLRHKLDINLKANAT